jgi:hypothetical protein
MQQSAFSRFVCEQIEREREEREGGDIICILHFSYGDEKGRIGGPGEAKDALVKEAAAEPLLHLWKETKEESVGQSKEQWFYEQISKKFRLLQ